MSRYASSPARPWAPRDDFALALARCEAWLAEHLLAARRRFGNAALGVVDLPPLSSAGRLDPVQLQTTAVLFWTYQVDQAGLLAFVDGLARGVVEGRLQLPLAEGAGELMAYWRERDERFGPEERAALYQRVFGGPGEPGGFQARLDELTRLLSEVGRAGPGDNVLGRSARARVVARELGEHLSERGAGVTPFAAREIVAHIRIALTLLQHPDIQRALGGGDPWHLLRLHGSMVLGRLLEPTPWLDRARAGLALLRWLAESALLVEDGSLPIEREGSAIQAAEQWRAAAGAT